MVGAAMSEKSAHDCGGLLARSDIYGPAITSIMFWDGQWWAGNGEYATAISFCPFCGVKLLDPEVGQ